MLHELSEERFGARLSESFVEEDIVSLAHNVSFWAQKLLRWETDIMGDRYCMGVQTETNALMKHV
jgi:hypothetical protein